MRDAGWAWIALGALVLAACGGGDEAPAPAIEETPAPPGLFVPPPAPVPLVEVSNSSPFASGCDRQSAAGTLYAAAEVEPSLAVNPLNPANRFGTWQQDRWSNGGARGVVGAVSLDGGQTWTARQVPFSRCSGGTAANGGDYARATDPWASFGPDGTLYWMAMTLTDTATESISAMRVARSTDGGSTWDAPITLIHDSERHFNDKNAITADPTMPGYAYAVWDRLDSLDETGPAYFARTTDGGLTWEAARPIYDPGPGAQTIGNLLVVRPDGLLVNLFTEIHYGTMGRPDSATLRVLRSLDRGDSWLPPVDVDLLRARGAFDPETGAPVRDGSILGTIAAGADGRLWVAWQDARTSAFARDGILLARSTDGGATWSAPLQVNGVPAVQAFTPTLQVAADGTLALSYYDFRDDTPATDTLLAGHWLATSPDGVTWTERRVSGPFDLRIAPFALGYFLGDYMALARAGDSLVPFFVQTVPDLANRTNVYTVSLPVAPPPGAKSAPLTWRAQQPAPAAFTPEAARLVGANIARARHHFPDRSKPALPPNFLR